MPSTIMLLLFDSDGKKSQNLSDSDEEQDQGPGLQDQDRDQIYWLTTALSLCLSWSLCFKSTTVHTRFYQPTQLNSTQLNSTQLNSIQLYCDILAAEQPTACYIWQARGKWAWGFGQRGRTSGQWIKLLHYSDRNSISVYFEPRKRV